MRNKHLVLFFLLFFTFSIGYAIVNPAMGKKVPSQDALKKTRDSIASRLPSLKDKDSRLKALYDLSDISLSMKDYSYTQKLWNEGVKYKDEYAMLDAGEAFVLKNLNEGKFDVADHWFNLCEKHFIGKTREPKLEYMRLMREIRDIASRPEMIQKLVKKHINPKSDPNKPYENMKELYELATFALSDAENNQQIKMKSWDSYMIEGYEIARKLPFAESYSFRHQFLMALSYVDVKYTKELVSTIERYHQEPFMRDRKYFSHVGEILAYSKLISSYQRDMRRDSLNAYFNKFNEITAKYPYECPTPYDFFYYDVARSYYSLEGNNEAELACLDSVIAACPKHKLDCSPYYNLKRIVLAKMNRWEEAYQTTIEYMNIKDSITASGTAEKLMELQTQYDVDHLRYENINKRNWLIFASVGGFLLIVLVIFLSRYNKMVRKRNSELVEIIHKREEEEEKARGYKINVPEEQLSREEKLFKSLEQLLSKQDMLQEKLGRDELAQMLNTNRTYITDAVKTCMDGMSVSDYINQVRLKRALKLLQENQEYSVAEIGEMCGFSSKSNFYRVFGKKYDITPGDYRKALLEKAKTQKES